MITPQQIEDLAAAAAAADGVHALDEATLLTLRHHPERVRAWGDYRGFGLLVGHELSLLVAPSSRGTGLGRQLYLRGDLPAEGPLTAWSHGDHPAAAALARSRGWRRARELWVMRTELRGDNLTPRGDNLTPRGDNVTPRGDNVTPQRLRAFRPEEPRDAAELLRVNAAAFAHHPEQGGMDAENLRERMSEPWFDPEDLIMAWDASAPDRLLGFHWTKRHSPTEGEVYVVGVDPAAQGRGLGRVLTAAGLDHLNAVHVNSVHLYVESDNTPAVRLYESLGFRRTETHVQYALG